MATDDKTRTCGRADDGCTSVVCVSDGCQHPDDAPDQRATMAELTKAELLAGEVRYAMRSEQHLWIVSATYTVDKEVLRAGGGETTLLNPERVRQLGAGCLVCNEAYDPRLLDRKCKGDPGGARAL